MDEPKTPIATAKLSLFGEFPDIGDAFTTTDATDSNIYSRQVCASVTRHSSTTLMLMLCTRMCLALRQGTLINSKMMQ
jgi:hypothetical protein